MEHISMHKNALKRYEIFVYEGIFHNKIKIKTHIIHEPQGILR